jgi:uncharacterized protein (DUF1684 family)
VTSGADRPLRPGADGGYVQAMAAPELELTDWRREVSGLYAAVRAAPEAEDGHALWQRGRDRLFREHPQSPLPADDPLRDTGLPYRPYDPALRFELELVSPAAVAETEADARLEIPTGGEEVTVLRRVGHVALPAPFDASLDVWWMAQYGGGLFVPLRDGSAGDTSYGGGRYLLDTAKSADLGPGRAPGTIVVDLNFAYHPSCRYNPEWVCPLAPPGNTITAPVLAGERL